MPVDELLLRGSWRAASASGERGLTNQAGDPMAAFVGQMNGPRMRTINGN